MRQRPTSYLSGIKITIIQSIIPFMDDSSAEYIRLAVEGLHDCKAEFKEKVHVTETFEGETVWEGDVYIFDIFDNPESDICYAWSSPIPQSDQQRYYAVLHQGSVKSAKDAVKTSILGDDQKGGE